MIKIHFVAARSPAQDPTSIIKALNYIASKHWSIERISREMMPVKKDIVSIGNQQQQVIPIDVIYCGMDQNDFELEFGIEYNPENAVQVLEGIEKEIFSGDKKGVINA